MPTADQILNGLREIANSWKTISILWHISFGVFAIILAIGYRPSRRFAGVLLGLPFLSVSFVSWLLPNPVNGAIFAVRGIYPSRSLYEEHVSYDLMGLAEIE